MGSGTQGSASQLGRVIGGYRLDKVVGEGGAGAVYLGVRVDGTSDSEEKTAATAIELPAEAAIKLLVIPWNLSPAEAEKQTKRFQREIDTLRSLRHRNILPIITSGADEESGSLYMVLPYLAGGSLRRRLKTATEPLPLDEVDSILRQVASAMDFAHEKGVVHRDIKPDNILLNEQGQAYLADFSIAQLLDNSATQLTQTGRNPGTFAYMAPEAKLGLEEAGFTSDIYSLGLVVHEMVAGLREPATGDPPAPRALRPDLPAPAEAAILKALRYEPAQRFVTATEFAEAFSQGLQGRWVAGLESPVTVAASGIGQPPTTDQSNATTVPATRAPIAAGSRGPRRIAALVAAALAVLLIAGVVGSSFLGHGVYIGFGFPGGVSATGKPKANVAPTTTPKKVAPTATHHSGGGGSSHTGGGTTTVYVPGGGGVVGGPAPAPTHTPTPRPTATFTPTPKPTPTFTPIPPPPVYYETTGGNAHTWTNYSNGGGTQGPTIFGQTTVRITCRVQGLVVSDGNPWWYKIGQSPWNGSPQYYASADAFYNNGQTSGSLVGTPLVDAKVPIC